MTPVLFHFITPDGVPLANARVDIQLSRSSYDEDHDGVLMPRLVEATTDVDGKVTVELAPADALYHVECWDTDSEAGLSYKFLVPEQEVPNTPIRLQDIVIVGEMSSTSYDEAALIAIHAAKATALTAAISAQASAATAVAAVDEIEDHMADPTGAHAASAISNTPAGGISATTVQAAINELDTEKARLDGAAFTGAVSATSFTGPLTGNASTATALATPRTINGTSFNGSADITITAAAGTLTGTTLAANVTSASLDSITPPWWGLSVTGIQTITANSWTPALAVTQNGSGYALTVSGAASFGGAVTAAGFTNTSSSITNTAADAGLEIGAKASANTPFIDFNSSGNSNDYDARIIASAGTTTGTGNLTVQANSLNVAGALGVTGQATFAAGSAAAPSVKVGAEQNGLYSSDANRLDLVAGGVRQAQVVYVAAAVNFLSLCGAVTGGGPTMYADGSDAAVNYNHSLKGAGNHVFYTGSTSAIQAVISHTERADRWITLTGSNGGNPTIGVSEGSLAITPNVVAAGTVTAAGFTGPLSGNASTATTLATARNINGVAFNGSADITITAAAGTLTGTTLASNVVTSSLNSITPTGGTLAVASGDLKLDDSRTAYWGAGSTYILGSSGSGFLRFYTGSSLRGGFDSAGLSVTGSISATGGATINSITPTGGILSIDGNLLIGTTSAASFDGAGGIGVSRSIAPGIFLENTGTGAQAFLTYVAPDSSYRLYNSTTNSDLLLVSASGDLLLGTTSAASFDGAGGIGVSRSSLPAIFLENTGTGAQAFMTYVATDSSYRLYNSTTNSELLLVSASGDLLINQTTNPSSYKLAVTGPVGFAGSLGTVHTSSEGIQLAFTRFGVNYISAPNGSMEYDGSIHVFKSPDQLTTFATINSTGLSVTGSINATGRINNSTSLSEDNSAVLVNVSATGYGLYSKGGSASRYAAAFYDKDDTLILLARTGAVEVTGSISATGVAALRTINATSDYTALQMGTAATAYGQIGWGTGGEVVYNAAAGATRQHVFQVSGSNRLVVDANGAAVTGTATAASFVGPLTGNASTATTLATARNINGVSFNGSADITVTAAAGTLTGATLAAGVTASSLTSVGTLTALTVSGTSTLGITRVSGADNSLQFGVSGATCGVRFNTSSFGSSIEGVDNTLWASYQPLNIVASVLGLYTTGGNDIALGTSGSTPQMYVTNTTSAVNFAQITGGVTGNAPTFSVGGSDTNVTARYRTQGTGSHQFETGSSGNIGLLVAHTASSVNYGQFTGNSAGGYPSLRAAGSDTNIGFDFATQGAAPFRFYTNAFGAEQFRVDHTANAVNYAQINGSATGLSVAYGAGGSDTNVNTLVYSKGAGAVAIYTGTGASLGFVVSHTAAAVNYLNLTGSATGNAVTISAQGSDTNIDFALTTKGTGVLRFGTHSALAAETVTGYITIKDSAGNTRKLAVVS